MDKKKTSNDLKEVNRTRARVGLKKITPIERRCLRCDKKFTSYGANHRMCGCTKAE